MYIYACCCKIGLTKTLINLKALQCRVTYTLHDIGYSHLTTQSTIITIVTAHHRHSSHSPPHEQLLEELGAGGVPSAVHTRNPPYEQWLIGVEHVHECRHVVVLSYWLF